jgi:Rod binding domain-containing protein
MADDNDLTKKGMGMADEFVGRITKDEAKEKEGQAKQDEAKKQQKKKEQEGND